MRYALPTGHAWVIEDEPEDRVVYLAQMPDGVPYILRSAAAAVWLAAITWGRQDDIVAEVAREYHVEVDVVESDALTFLENLAEHGLLAQMPSEDAAAVGGPDRVNDEDGEDGDG
ncbi:MAG: PqqD family protein [Nostocoides sp.]